MSDIADFDDAGTYPTLAEMSVRRLNDLQYTLARDFFITSMPRDGGEPTLSPERAFTLAAEFIVEGARRKL